MRSQQINDDDRNLQGKMVKFRYKLVAMLLFVVMFWPRYVFFPISGVGLSPFSVAIVILEFVSIMTLVLSRRRGRINRNIMLITPYIIYILWMFICDYGGIYPEISIYITLRSVIYLHGAFFIGVYVASNPGLILHIPVIFSSVVVITGIVGIVERIFQVPFVTLTGISAYMVKMDSLALLIDGAFRNGNFRASSIFSNPIVFSQFIGASAGFALHLCIYSKRIKRGIGVIALIIAPIALYVSETRSGYILCLVSTTVYILQVATNGKKNKPNIAAYIMLLLIMTTTYVFQGEIRALISGRDSVELSSSQSRDLMITTGVSAMMESPLTGFGDGMSLIKAGLQAERGTLTIDNTYLSVMLDFGYTGICIYVALMFIFISRGLILVFTEKESLARKAYASIMSFCIAIIIGQYVISIQDNMMFVYLFFGVIANPGEKRVTSNTHENEVRSVTVGRPRYSI